MAIDNVLQQYISSDKTLQLTEKLKSGGAQHVCLKGLIGSSASFVASAISKTIPQTHLFILTEKEEAAYFLNDLENNTGGKNIFFFPSSYRKAYDPEHTDNANISLRAEVLSAISTKSNTLIVTYPEALNEKVVTKKHLEKNTLSLRVGEKISIDFITQVVLEYHFNRVDYVAEPGEFSVRGGIVDIFSFANELPYRIEFSGNSVDSIRSFDAATQLSVQTVSSCSIIPNLQIKIAQENRQTFFEFIPENTIVWLKDTAYAADKIEQAFDAAEKIYEQKKSLIEQLQPSEIYSSKKLFFEQLENFKTIEFGSHFYFNSDIEIQYNIVPQIPFNKNFNLLLDHLKGNIAKGFQNIIFSDTPKQLERLHKIFEDVSGTNSLFFQEGNTGTLSEGFTDNDLKIACYTDHQIFNRHARFRLKSGFKKTSEAITLKELKGLHPGDFVTHIDHGVGRFAGLEKMDVNGKQQEVIRIMYRDNDLLYVSIHSLHRIAKYSGKEGAEPKINKLGSNSWSVLKQKTKKKVKEIAFDLIQLYAKRKALKGLAFSPDTYLQTELEASFIYEDTPDQVKATVDTKKDMESESPMDRLICGDVGFGKTEIAIRAAFKAVADSKQVAVLVPTTILALQHYKTFKERLGEMPCKVDYLNRFRTAKEQKEVLEKTARGEIDILIGTHILAGKNVSFKDLGLLIIDEEQKFGVSVKEKLKTISTNVDTLTLTATPIPRTLQFSMMGARDLSVINTPPPNRHPVQTELHSFHEEVFRDAIAYEMSRNGQTFVIHNRVQSIKELAGMIQRLCPDAKVAIAHGQMEGHKLEEVMLDFIEGNTDVLVATSIIESGLDIPNANTIIIDKAHFFGLSDLHQMRGRVGRSNKKAFCHLITPPLSTLTPEARKRLKAIEEFSDLGSGFNISMRDLDIRGAGNLLGAEQSGFINEIGFEMYHKILDEAMQELTEEMGEEQAIANKQNRPQKFVKDCQIDTDLELLISEEYVQNTGERLSLYRELDNFQKEEELILFEQQLKDRFGVVPQATRELIRTIRLRWIAMELGLEKVVLKSGKLIGYFISKQDAPFYQSEMFTQVLQFVQKNPHACKMKENNAKLTLSFDHINSIETAIHALSQINRKKTISELVEPNKN